MPKRRPQRPVPTGLASVQVVIRLPSGMRLRYSSKVAEAEAQVLWATLFEHAAEAPKDAK